MRIIFGTIMLLLSMGMSAQEAEEPEVEMARKPLIQWNSGLGCSLNYSHYHTPLKGDEYVKYAPQDFLEVDFNLWGVYFAIACPRSAKTGYKVYGYDEKVDALAWKLGPSWRINLNDESSMSITPYIGSVRVKVDDTSHNEIGARTDYGTHASGMLIGGKLAYVHKGVEFSVHGSNREFGIGIGGYLNLPF